MPFRDISRSQPPRSATAWLRNTTRVHLTTACANPHCARRPPGPGIRVDAVTPVHERNEPHVRRAPVPDEKVGPEFDAVRSDRSGTCAIGTGSSAVVGSDRHHRAGDRDRGAGRDRSGRIGQRRDQLHDRRRRGHRRARRRTGHDGRHRRGAGPDGGADAGRQRLPERVQLRLRRLLRPVVGQVQSHHQAGAGQPRVLHARCDGLSRLLQGQAVLRLRPVRMADVLPEPGSQGRRASRRTHLVPGGPGRPRRSTQARGVARAALDQRQQARLGLRRPGPLGRLGRRRGRGGAQRARALLRTARPDGRLRSSGRERHPGVRGGRRWQRRAVDVRTAVADVGEARVGSAGRAVDDVAPRRLRLRPAPGRRRDRRPVARSRWRDRPGRSRPPRRGRPPSPGPTPPSPDPDPAADGRIDPGRIVHRLGGRLGVAGLHGLHSRRGVAARGGSGRGTDPGLPEILGDGRADRRHRRGGVVDADRGVDRFVQHRRAPRRDGVDRIRSDLGEPARQVGHQDCGDRRAGGRRVALVQRLLRGGGQRRLRLRVERRERHRAEPVRQQRKCHAAGPEAHLEDARPGRRSRTAASAGRRPRTAASAGRRSRTAASAGRRYGTGLRRSALRHRHLRRSAGPSPDGPGRPRSCPTR